MNILINILEFGAMLLIMYLVMFFASMHGLISRKYTKQELEHHEKVQELNYWLRDVLAKCQDDNIKRDLYMFRKTFFDVSGVLLMKELNEKE